jgi:hypothetical protein
MIKGLTDRGQAFPQIGNIRKGDKSGKNGAPKDLNYFRVEFDEKETQAAAAFAAAYPNQPTEVNIFLPFNEIERCWDAWCEGYTAGRMVARSDGENFLYLVDLATGSLVVRDGVRVDNGQKEPHREVLGKAKNSVIKCKPVGRLKVLIPELRRLAYMVVHTTSVIDIRNLSEQLEAIKQINGGQIVGVPLVLKRRPKEISVPNADGTKRRLVKWMLSIEADPRWVEAKIAQLDRLALPDGGPRLALPAVAETTEEEDDNQIDGEHEWIEEPEEGEWSPSDELEADPAMTYEEACTVADKRGKLYTEAPTEMLAKLVAGLELMLETANLTPEYQAETRRRLEAVTVIAAYRASNPQ